MSPSNPPSHPHPRRTPTKATSPALTPSPSPSSPSSSPAPAMSLRKAATFHYPSDSSSYHSLPALPRRSQSTLDDVVDAHKRRVALTLGDIDRSLAAVDHQPSSSTARQSFPDDADPIPRAFLDHSLSLSPSPSPNPYTSATMDALIKQEPADSGARSLRPRRRRRPSRCSDSALGSSIVSASGKQGVDSVPTADDQCVGSIVTASAITRSAAAHSSTLENLPRLSSRASNRIHEHILRPLLAKPSLKDFHPIVKDCPRRIHGKEIVCLRDLEKTLIFMAPERAKTAALYLDFCLTSIRCIQATVDLLSEREQTRPHDRPYTNAYFVDLVDQIKQYAQQVQAAKEKEAKGEKLDEMDPEPTDEVRLHGGLTKNGRPAELVRVKKNGKAISIATGMPVDIEEESKGGLQMKRSLSQEAEDDEAIMRSMARRKRSASAAELAPKRCREPGCEKEFKRSCDLTKHEKTHSRPWKCPVESCKYHEYGWPTEKEMDRHHNDKHSAAPALFECHFKPCPYRSKRESNCKQHMEKAHGWEYVRSKSNGKNREKATQNGLPTPPPTNIRTPSSDGNVISTPEEEELDLRKGSATIYDHPQNQLNFPEYNSDSDIDMFTNHQLQLDYSPLPDELHQGAPDHSPYIANSMAGQDQFAEAFPEYPTDGIDFTLYDNEDLYSANVQLPTPSHEIFQALEASPFATSGIPYGTDAAPHISPVGHGNTMLYTPTSLREVDEGFEDFIPSSHPLGVTGVTGMADFQLFPSSTGGTVASSAPSGLFGTVPPPISFPDATAQELLGFYAASTQAAIQGHHNGGMDWTSDVPFSDYTSEGGRNSWPGGC